MHQNKRFAGFIILPLLSALSPLLLLPIAARVEGAAGWTTFATSQAVGIAAGTVISYGWYISGPPRIARSLTNAIELRGIYSESIRTKFLISLILLPLGIIAAVHLAADGQSYTAASTALASMLLYGFTFAWFQIGKGDPRPIAWFETIPRLVGTIISCFVILATGRLYWYGLILTASVLFGLFVFHNHTFQRWTMLREFNGVTLRTALARGFPSAGVALVGLGFSALPMPLITATQPVAVAGEFASALKLYVYGLIVITAVMDAVQAWALKSSEKQVLHRRFKQVCLIMVIIGSLGFVALSFLGSYMTELMFGEMVRASPMLVAIFGISYFASALNTPTIRLRLIPEGQSTVVLRNNIISVATGVALMVLGVWTFGALGLAAGLAMGQLLYAFLNWASISGSKKII